MAIWFSDRDRWFLWSPFLFGIGIHFYFAEWVTNVYIIGALQIIAIISAILLRKNVGVYVAIGSVIVALGLTAAAYRTHTTANNYHRLEKPWSGAIFGTVDDIDVMNGQFRLVLSDIKNGPDQLNRLRINFRYAKENYPKVMEDLKPGDRVRTYVHLFPPTPPETALNYDFEFWAFFQKIEAVGFGSAKYLRLYPSDTRKSGFDVLRYKIASAIRAVSLGQTGEIATALITGYRNGIIQKIRDDFSGSGLAHLLAISGLHLSLIAGLMFFVFRRILSLSTYCALHFPLKKIAAFLALLCSFFYLKISGESLPTMRAFIMITFIMVAIMLDREAISLRSVAWAALIVLGVKPESLYSPSFQMSFAAVTALIGVYEYFRTTRLGIRTSALTGYQRALNYLGGAAFSSFIASVATLPFIIHTFHRFSWHSIEANLIAIPLMSFWIMPCAIIVLLLMPFGLHEWPLKAMGLGIEGLVRLAETVNSWPGSFIPVGIQHDWFVGLILVGGAWLLIWTHRWRWLGMVPIVLAAVLPGKEVFLLVAQSQDRIGVLANERTLLTPSGRASFIAQDWRGIVDAYEVLKLSKYMRDSGGMSGEWVIEPFSDQTLRVVINPVTLMPKSADVVVEGFPKTQSIKLASGERVKAGSVLWRDQYKQIRSISLEPSKMPWRSQNNAPVASFNDEDNVSTSK